jgi:hypothetical protein
MLQRRSFLTISGSGLLAQPAARPASDKRTGFYLLEQFFMKHGTQLGRMHEYLGSTQALMAKLHTGPRIYLEALVAPHMPQIASIIGFSSLDALYSERRKAAESRDLMKAFEAWENGPEPPYEHLTSWLLQATDYSPEIVLPSQPPKTPRIFELRTYHSPSWRQLKALHERFAGPEIKIFHRVGVHPILYTSTAIGPHMPNLTYLIPFETLAAREKAWEAFGADPEWQKVRKESIDRSGQIANVIQISLYRATPYSPIR